MGTSLRSARSTPWRRGRALTAISRDVDVELGVLPLAGFTVAVTAERRREELCALLRRRGARVVSAPALGRRWWASRGQGAWLSVFGGAMNVGAPCAGRSIHSTE